MILLFTWVILLPAAASRHPQGVQRRQALLPPGRVSPGCMSAFLGLEGSQLICLSRLGGNIGMTDRANSTVGIELTEDQLDYACGSPTCLSTFVTLIEACEVCRVCVRNE